MAKWTAFNDWCSWHIGWFPTAGDARQFSLQHIRGWCWNLDIAWGDHDWRIQWRQARYRDWPGEPRTGRGLVIDRG